MASIERWQDQIYELEEIEDKPTLFDRFADIEEEMEPLESQVQEVVSIIDQAIQAAIDIARPNFPWLARADEDAAVG
jgi:hypothetical protein